MAKLRRPSLIAINAKIDGGVPVRRSKMMYLNPLLGSR
eukprot:CAMPEP_0115545916 /NCGR_PEP_ID=MMETSP0271-20121206/92850_1 /TAXON_ID=71861 /ORGANISM="Scrippsiella trochoidea, Strain CCMP3099" /LENGTH=37 /DNA_ID= /DNA_START= /DNA_END= /DNA_ORIENTATION=